MSTKPKRIISLKSTSQDKKYLLLEEAKCEFLLDCHSRRLSEYTIQNYTKAIDYFISFVGNINLYDVTDSDLKRWLVHLNSKNAVNSVRSWIKCVKIFFKYFKIVFDVKNPSEEKKVLECYTDEEIKLLLTKPKRKSFGRIRDYTIVCFLLGTGVRTSTLINIKIKDVDFKQHTIFLSTTKTHKQYTIPLSASLANVLTEYLGVWNHNEDDYLFPSVFGDQLEPNALRQIIYNYHKVRGVSSYSVHKYRRTYAVNYLKKCNNVFFLQQLLGHSDISTTRKYCPIDLEDVKNNYDDYNPLDNNLRKKSIKLNRKHIK